jgi:hypothetical protein
MNIERINQLISKGEDVIRTYKPNPPNVIGFPTLNNGKFNSWRSQSLTYIKEVTGKDNEYYITFDTKVTSAYKSNVEIGIGILEAILEDYENGYFVERKKENTEKNFLSILLDIFSKFHTVVKQLRNRYNDRDNFEINDEYDVQDLIHALLYLYFDDIRAEEWTPSYAGKSSRMDFLLKDEKIVIEVKKTRKTLKAKELGSQLIEDISRYQSHPDCETLVCFAYDPDGWIANPVGIENDLRESGKDFKVEVIIRPR